MDKRKPQILPGQPLQLQEVNKILSALTLLQVCVSIYRAVYIYTFIYKHVCAYISVCVYIYVLINTLQLQRCCCEIISFHTSPCQVSLRLDQVP